MTIDEGNLFMKFSVERVKLPVKRTTNWRGASITHIEDVSYQTAPYCPICGNTNTHSLIAVGSYSQKGLDLHFCSNCEHTFFKRYPDDTWYLSYYKEDKDLNIQIKDSYYRSLKRFIRNTPVVYDLWLKKRVSTHRTKATIQSLLNEILQTSARDHHVNTGLSWLAESKIQNVLDIGCGFGDTLLLYKSLGLSALGIDASPKRVQICRSKGLNVSEVSISDITSIRNAGPFDLISSTHVLEHIVDLSRHLTQVLELCHEKTYVYFEVPNASQENLFSRVHNPSHAHIFSLKSLVYLLSRFGFNAIRISQDLNTHVLAVRSNSDYCPFSYSETGGKESYRTALSYLKNHLGKKLRISYALMNYHTVITNLESGEEIFRYDPGYHTRKLPEGNIIELEGLLEGHRGSSLDSLRILHDSDKAPIIL